MKGTDWLRDKVRQRKPATGGTISADQAAAIPRSGCVHPGTGYVMPGPAPRTNLVRIGELELREPTAAERAQMARQLGVMLDDLPWPKPATTDAPEPEADVVLDCACAILYSRCHCGH